MLKYVQFGSKMLALKNHVHLIALFSIEEKVRFLVLILVLKEMP